MDPLPIYTPNDPVYWDEDALGKEIDRIFDICHGCRLCFNLCPSFPALFDAADGHDGDVMALTDDDRRRVVDLCYQCKICYVKCPYIPPHEFQLDFPRLLIRAKAVRAKKEGIPVGDRLLADPDRLGRLASITPNLVNWMNEISFHRKVMRNFLGIHPDKKLPAFHGETFSEWIHAHPPQNPSEEAGRVVFFHTCYVNYNDPALGKAVIDVLERNHCRIASPPQCCCGMPAIDVGDVNTARSKAIFNVEHLKPFADDGYTIIAPNPTCSYMLRFEYPELVGTEAARDVASCTMDVSEYLMTLKQNGKLDTDFKESPGKIAYHIPCHLRAQNIGFKSRDLMKLIPGAQISVIEQCSAHDGTWAMKDDYFELSMKWGKKCFSGMTGANPQTPVTDCPLAALQIEQATGLKPIHPVQVLQKAYHGKDQT